MMALGVFCTVFKVNQLDLKAGTFAPQDYYLFSEYINKPYTRFTTYSIGVLTAYFYTEILRYRRLRVYDKVHNSPKLHFLH